MSRANTTTSSSETLDELAQQRMNLMALLQRRMRREAGPVPDDHPLLRQRAATAWRTNALRFAGGDIEAACELTHRSVNDLRTSIDYYEPGVGAASVAEQLRAIMNRSEGGRT